MGGPGCRIGPDCAGRAELQYLVFLLILKLKRNVVPFPFAAVNGDFCR